MGNKKLVGLVCGLLAIFVAVVGLVPNLVKSKDIYAAYSYQQKVLQEDKVSTIHIEIDESDFAAMLENPLAEEYYSANIVVNGDRVNNVAIRTKGNSSLTRVASDEESNRYSFKIDIDKYDDQSLSGLTKLCLNNCYTDASYMREYISYKLMKEMEIPTPAFGYMHVYVNGQEWGLYLGVEAVEETFLANNFTDGTGDLYKPDGTTLAIDPNQLEEYVERLALKTNEDSSDHSAMRAFLDIINNGGDLESVMDTDAIIRYFAANTALVSLDSYQGNMLHNYYLYEENGVFSVIPWDHDLSFGVFSIGMGGQGRGNHGEQAVTDKTDAVADDTNLDKSAADDTIPDENAGNAFAQQSESGGGRPAGSPQAGGTHTLPEAMQPPDQAAPPDEAPNGMPEPAAPPDAAENESDAQASGENASEDQNQEPNEQLPGPGGMGGMQNINLSEATINFPIDTPVSNYTISDYPLIGSWLSQDEYKEIYHSYLQEIATGFFSESRITALVGQTANMIRDYVASDPNSKYTTEQFTEGYQDIIRFSTARAQSILGQLSGEIASTQEPTGSSPGMGMGGGRGGMRPEGMEMPDENWQPPEGFAPEEQPVDVAAVDAPTQNAAAPNADTQGTDTQNTDTPNGREAWQAGMMGEGGPPAMGGMGRPGGPMQQEQVDYTAQNLVIFGFCAFLLILVIITVFFFRRRGRHQII